MVRDGKGAKDRVTMLPQVIKPALQQHLARVKLLHEKDLAAGQGEVYLPVGWSGNIRTRTGSGPGVRSVADRDGGARRVYPNCNRASRDRAKITSVLCSFSVERGASEREAWRRLRAPPDLRSDTPCSDAGLKS